jgi:hypothetical protein
MYILFILQTSGKDVYTVHITNISDRLYFVSFLTSVMHFKRTHDFSSSCNVVIKIAWSITCTPYMPPILGHHSSFTPSKCYVFQFPSFYMRLHFGVKHLPLSQAYFTRSNTSVARNQLLPEKLTVKTKKHVPQWG